MADPTAFLDAIAGGDYDGQLGDLLNAVLARAAETETSFGWRIRLAGDEWDMESVTLQELAFAERALSTGSVRVSYLELDPLKSMDHLVALIVAHLHHVAGRGIQAAFAEARKLTVVDLQDIVFTYEVKGRPKADNGQTSPT
jgi:hypothetical protein